MSGWVAGAIVVGGAVSAGAGMIAADKAASAQERAATMASDATLQSTRETLALQEKIYEEGVARNAPWIEAGENALRKLAGGSYYTGTEPNRDDFYIPGKEEGAIDDEAYSAAVAKYNAGMPKKEDYTTHGDGGSGLSADYYADLSKYKEENPEPRKEDFSATEFDQAAYDKALAEYEATKVTEPGLVNQGPGQFEKSPGYAFRLSEGQKAIDRSAAARGNSLSGAAVKESMRFGQDYATNDYDNFLNRYYQSLTPYQSLAGVGQTAVGQTNAAGQDYANSAANINMNAANAISANTIAAGNASAAGTINSANAITGSVNSGINNYLMWKYMQ